MTKSDLKSCMVIEIRDGDRFIAVQRDDKLIFINLNGNDFFDIDEMSENMTFSGYHNNCDIMTVYKPQYNLDACRTTTEIIWTRPKPKEMTIGEIEKILGYSIEIVDRYPV